MSISYTAKEYYLELLNWIKLKTQSAQQNYVQVLIDDVTSNYQNTFFTCAPVWIQEVISSGSIWSQQNRPSSVFGNKSVLSTAYWDISSYRYYYNASDAFQVSPTFKVNADYIKNVFTRSGFQQATYTNLLNPSTLKTVSDYDEFIADVGDFVCNANILTDNLNKMIKPYIGGTEYNLNNHNVSVGIGNGTVMPLQNNYSDFGYSTGMGWSYSGALSPSAFQCDIFNLHNANVLYGMTTFTALQPDNGFFRLNVTYNGRTYYIYIISIDTVDEVLNLLIPGMYEYIGPVQPASAAAKLSSLSIDGAENLTPSFDSDVFEYTATVYGDLITINASGDENCVKIGLTDGNHMVYSWSTNVSGAIFRRQADMGTQDFYVIAEDSGGNQTEYKLTITFSSSEPRLMTMTVTNGTMSPTFSGGFHGPYTITTLQDSVTYGWNPNAAVTSVKINNTITPTGYSHTFSNLIVGNTIQANITVYDSHGNYFDYEIYIKRVSELQALPRMSLLSVYDNTGYYNINPRLTDGVYNYNVTVNLDATFVTLKTYFYESISALTITIDGNEYIEGNPYRVGLTGGHGATVVIVASNSVGDVTYILNIHRGSTNNESYIPGGNQNLRPEVADFVSNYNPGFYGGSYVPNYRYVREIFTTSQSDADYAIRKSTNEEAVNYLNDMISNFTYFGGLDAICEAFIHYSNFINDDSGGVDWRYVLPAINVNILRPSTLTKKNLTPKNNKCFAYPFSALEINGYGTQSIMAYEEFAHTFVGGKHQLSFDILCKWFAGTSIQVVPVNFQQVEDNFDYAVSGPEMPVFPYTKDAFLNEYNAARNTRSQALEAARQTAALERRSAIYSGVKGLGEAGSRAAFSENKKEGYISAGISAFGTSAGTIVGIKKINLQLNQQKAAMAAELADAAVHPATITNQNASPSITMVMKDAACPFIQHLSIRPEFLEKVDKFFTRFGYRTNRTGVPNIYKRENFCYLECKNAVIGGNIPAEDKQALKAIMEHGITFWHYGSTNFAGVGNYKDSDSTYNVAPYR